jgi:catechol 2,3-dioxygenase
MTGDVIHPTFHHVTLKTTRLHEMIDFYAILVGAEVIHQDPLGAWLTNDRANHRIALLAFPHCAEDPDKERHTGLHHTAYEHASFADLNGTYLRLEDAGIEPAFCLDHGMTLSYYYADPDGNYVELQMDAFGDWAWSKAWMKNSADFKTDPIGKFVDPAAIAADHAAGMAFDEIHAKAMRGGYAPQQQSVAVPEPSA